MQKIMKREVKKKNAEALYRRAEDDELNAAFEVMRAADAMMPDRPFWHKCESTAQSVGRLHFKDETRCED